MKLTDEQKIEIGMRFTMLAKDIKSSLDSLMYAAPEMRDGWRARMWADIGECCAEIIDLIEDEAHPLAAAVGGRE